MHRYWAIKEKDKRNPNIVYTQPLWLQLLTLQETLFGPEQVTVWLDRTQGCSVVLQRQAVTGGVGFHLPAQILHPDFVQCSARCDILIPPLVLTMLLVTWLAQVWGKKNGLQLPSSVLKLPLNTHALHDCLPLTEFTFRKVHIKNLLFRLTVHYPWNMGIVGSRWKAASVQSTRINLPDCSAQDFTSAAWDQDPCNLVGRTAFGGFHWG